MAVQVSYPGVYIEEFAPGAPIEGVGTSTAAFIGPAESGSIDQPTKITSFDRFRELYGAEPMPGFYLWPRSQRLLSKTVAASATSLEPAKVLTTRRSSMTAEPQQPPMYLKHAPESRVLQ